METLGFSAGEQKAIWHVLAGIYHLGAAGACRGSTDSSSPSSSLNTLSVNPPDTGISPSIVLRALVDVKKGQIVFIDLYGWN